ncbi:MULTISPECIES: hypothetical protein [unclassified Streptomyces]|uniref:hypothetical protein n=1 Tax=unclassified Streptomyces TaxID=2593676 RepID=UPI000B86505A|nr:MULTISPECIES: hypothetical protein [unclassified Streptomyces]MYS23598.1 hypothetical protein [Streptomyces sp. SID4948]
MFELVLSKGLLLPLGAGLLTVGMSEREAQDMVATLADVREGWQCGAGWSFVARYEGLGLTISGDVSDRWGVLPDMPGLRGVAVARHTTAPTGPSAVPVVLDDVDLFGYPEAEILSFFGTKPYPGLWLRPADPGGNYLREIWFTPGATSQPQPH